MFPGLSGSSLEPRICIKKSKRLKEILEKYEASSKIHREILKQVKSSILPPLYCRQCKTRIERCSSLVEEFGGRRLKDFEKSCNANKPRFIMKLEKYIDKELSGLNDCRGNYCQKGSSSCDHLICEEKKLDVELSVYRSAFDIVLSKIRTFGPILERIKSVYDKCIDVRNERIKLGDILTSNLEYYKIKIEKKVEAIRRIEAAKVEVLKNQNLDYVMTINELRNEIEDHKRRINSLRNEIFEIEEKEIKRIIEIRNSNSNKVLKNRRENDDESSDTNEASLHTSVARGLIEDPILMRVCLQRARKDLSSAHRKIAELEETFRDVAPKWELERLENRYQDLEKEYRNLAQEMEALKKEHETLNLNFAAVREQKNELRDRCKMLAHTNTPRPDWSKCGQFVQGGVQRWRDITAKKSSEDRLTILLSELCGAASAENDYFVGKGTDPSVPIFLRWKGKMRNRKLGRREVSMLINDLWKNKVVTDLTTPMGDYLVKYFTERYNIRLLRYEWIYNLYYACQRLVYDDQIGLFWNILWGNVAEEAYHVPRKEFIVLKRMMEMRMEDKKINALLSQDIIEVLDTVYPYKSNKDIEEIVYAAAKQLEIDPSTEAFDVAKLFAETEEGSERGELARELSRQTIDEITKFGKAILQSIDVQEKDTEVPVEALRKGFTEIDESIPQTLLTQHLKWIYKVQDLTKAKPMVSSAIIRQMINGYIRRSTRPNIQQRKT